MVRRVPAADRLDRTQFRTQVEYYDHIVQLAAYRCPHCRIIYAQIGDQYRIFDADLLEVIEVAQWPEPSA